jgi:predicted site-specific integrase-resolvase
MKQISISKTATILGVSQKTLRNWEKEGKIKVSYTPNGHRRYNYDYINNFYDKESI